MRTSNLKKRIVPLLALVGCFLAAGVSAQTCEFPLFITQGTVAPNALLIVDNSGSMNEAIWHQGYDPAITYTGGYSAASTYYISSDGWYTANGRDAYLVNSDGGQSGRYVGNYLNWVYYHASDTQRAEIPRITRIQVAKACVNDVVHSNPGIRFGVMQFNYSDGGSVVSKLGTDEATLLSQVNGIVASTWTPIAETMVDALEYFQSTGADAPIQYKCQRNFLVVISDGYPTMDRNIPAYIGDQDGDGNEPGDCAGIGAPYDENNECSDYMDDVAWYLQNNDLRTDLDGDQNVVTYAIGFAIDAPLFQETADNGGGLYLSADSPDQLAASLAAIVQDIENRISSGSAVAVVSTEGESEDLLFRGKFTPSGWRGYLEAFTLPYEEDEDAFWEAGELLSARDPSTRTIYTIVGEDWIELNDGYADALQVKLDAASPEEAADIINWTRGESIAGYRDRSGWLLPDIVDSSPTVVGPPRSFFLYGDYLLFRSDHSDRTRVIYIGCNGGMLHCFREADGVELWSFIPESILPRLKGLCDPGYCHEYFVDLTPRVADVMINDQWKTILIGGLRAGGGTYFALDVTYPDNPQFMWEVNIPEVNESWAHPEIVRVASLDKSVAFVGTGPDELNGEARLIAIDLADGSEIWSTLLSTKAGMNMSTAATAIDMEFDGYEDLLYIGDLDGSLWRVDLTTSPWDVARLFATDQPIQAQPIVTVDYNNDVYVYFGTGQYVEPADITDTAPQTFYCVIDNHSGTTVSRYDMVDQTTDIHPVSNSDRGWYIDLQQGMGERIVEPDALVAGIVYFTSFAPSLEPCTAGGYSWLYKVKFRNGAADDGDDDDGNDGTEGRVEDIGDGVTTKAVIDIVNENVIIQGSDTRIHVRDTAGTIRQLIVRSWRQIYQ